MPAADFSLKPIKPNIGGGRVSGCREKLTSSDKDRITEVYVKATLGNVKLRNKVSADIFEPEMENGTISKSSDYRVTFKGLWPPAIGVLELGIITL
ncbi:hypothetical protein V6N11_057909 [Hibiscus sabdariffa]|uniref:Uncharacterized protein n=1 Tax=Hibiscus sabdariffa TaxID=183260 RepID=A0ABR2P3X3_9ROSI